MSLLLDARKKSQQTCSAQSGDSGMDAHKLFSAKPPAQSVTAGNIRRNLAIILSGMLFAGGTGYLIHTSHAGADQAPRLGTVMPRYSGATAKPRIRNVSAPAIAAINNTGASQPKRLMRVALTVDTPPSPHIRIEQKTGLIDPLLGNAYLAYRSGRLDEAQRLYQEMLAKDTHNIDALLGLAVIAQRSDEQALSARYYFSVLTLDPRNSAANAGMSALSTDEHNENHLKALLDEQNDSAALHFALGNHYAGQSRWRDAQLSYFNAYTLESDNAQFTFNLAISFDHLGENELAVQYYQNALQLDRQNVARTSGTELDHTRIEQRIDELTR